MTHRSLIDRRQAWLDEMAATYNGDGINPEGKLAATNQKSIAGAIVARCWQCVGRNADPKAVERIRQCTVQACALHPLRPHQSEGIKTTLAVLKQTAATPEPGKVISPIERARANPASRSLAIRAYCYDCMGGQPVGQPNANGNVRKQVGECATVNCALWDARPWQPGFAEPAHEADGEHGDAPNAESKITGGNAGAEAAPAAQHTITHITAPPS